MASGSSVICDASALQAQQLTQARSAVDSAKAKLDDAQKAVEKKGWRAYRQDRERVQLAQQNLNFAQAQLNAEQSVSRANQEGFLRSAAAENNDAALKGQLDRRVALSQMMVSLRAIEEQATQSVSAGNFANTSGKVATASLAVATWRAWSGEKSIAVPVAASLAARLGESALEKKAQRLQGEMMQTVEQFNAQAAQLGLPGFNSSIAVGIKAEAPALMQKTATALQETLGQLEADFKALQATCR